MNEEQFKNMVVAAFKARSDQEFIENIDFYEQPDYSDAFKVWLRESCEAIKMWAMAEGWNMCEDFRHNMMIGYGNEGRAN